MSYSSRVQVGGKKMTVVYAAAQLPISTGVGLWQKSREVRRHLERTHTSYCFAASKAGEGIEVWWSAEERGVSIAASLDDWYSTRLEENDDTPDDCVVIISFDTSVYLAEFANGLVKTERVVDEKSAVEHLDRYRAENRVMHGFMSGSQTGLIEQYVELEPLPFDLRSNRFERSFVVFLRHRLYHPMVIVPVLTLFSIVTLSQIDLIGLRDGIIEYYNRNEPAVPQIQDIPIVSHAGGAMLRELVKFMWQLDVLYPDGLLRMEFTPPSSIVLRGISPEYPTRAKAFSDRRLSQFRWNSAGWVIMIDIAMPDMVEKTPMRTEALLEKMSRGWSALGLVEGPIAGYTHTTRFNIDQTDINTFDLIDIAHRLDGYPAVISYLSCKYAKYRMTDCEVSIETKTL